MFAAHSRPDGNTLSARPHQAPAVRVWLFIGGICAALFVLDLVAVQAGWSTRADTDLALAVHGRFGHPTYGVFVVISDLGSAVVRTILAGLISLALVCRHRTRIAVTLVVAVASGALVNLLVKDIVARPRPHLFHDALHASGYAFPSGHAMDSMIFFGALIYVAGSVTVHRRWIGVVTIVCLALTLLVGLSRVVLGVHYPTDVVGGFLLGGAWLALICGVGPRLPAPAYPWRRR